MTAPMIPQRAPRLRDQVYGAVRAMLRDGTYPDGGLAEDELASRLAVSRTPIREALFQLCREGVLEDTGRGYRRPELSARDVREIVELRRLVEPGMARAIVAKAGPELVAAFRAVIADEAAAADLPAAGAFIQANAAFRDRFFAAFGNRRVDQVMQAVDDRVAHLRQMTLGPAANRHATLAAHRHFLAALEAGDRDAAAAAIIALIDAAGAYYDTIWSGA